MGKEPYLSFQSKKCCSYSELTDALTFRIASLKSCNSVGLMLLMSTLAISFMLRKGIIAASTLKFFKSAPEYPLVNFVNSSISASYNYICLLPDCSLAISRQRNYLLPAAFGKGIYSFLTKRLLTASSRSSGLLVAPIINILASSPANVFAPSN